MPPKKKPVVPKGKEAVPKVKKKPEPTPDTTKEELPVQSKSKQQADDTDFKARDVGNAAAKNFRAGANVVRAVNRIQNMGFKREVERMVDMPTDLKLSTASSSRSSDRGKVRPGSRNDMFHAAKTGNLAKIMDLYRQGAFYLKNVNETGDTPMHAAAANGHMDVIELLVKLGADQNAKNANQQTPLHTAAMSSSRNVARTLLRSGADPYVQDRWSKIPLSYVKEEILYDLLLWFPVMTDPLGDKNTVCWHTQKFGQGAPKEVERKHGLVVMGKTGLRLSNYVSPNNQMILRCLRQSSVICGQKYSTEPGSKLVSDVYSVTNRDNEGNISICLRVPVRRDQEKGEIAKVKFEQHSRQSELQNKPLVLHKRREPDDTTGKVEISFDVWFEEVEPGEVLTFVIIYIQEPEIFKVGPQPTKIKSEFEIDFGLSIPQEAFRESTELALQIYEPDQDELKAISKELSILSKFFQINVKGMQPSRALEMTLPLSTTKVSNDDIVIVSADEKKLRDPKSFEVVADKPAREENNMNFTVRHFSVSVAVSRPWWLRPDSPQQLADLILKVKEVTFFIALQSTPLADAEIIVECTESANWQNRKLEWEEHGFVCQIFVEPVTIKIPSGKGFDVLFSENVHAIEISKRRNLTFQDNMQNYTRYNISLLNGDGGDVILTELDGQDGDCKEEGLRVQLPFSIEKKNMAKKQTEAVQAAYICAKVTVQFDGGQDKGHILDDFSLHRLGFRLNRHQIVKAGVHLGLPANKVEALSNMSMDSSSFCFNVLHLWRTNSKQTQTEKELTLIRALTAVGRKDLADVLSVVRKMNRSVEATDFLKD